ncbi:MAG: hypothetical protein Fur0011_3260 [Candidatus Microgenomates bacterium]
MRWQGCKNLSIANKEMVRMDNMNAITYIYWFLECRYTIGFYTQESYKVATPGNFFWDYDCRGNDNGVFI